MRPSLARVPPTRPAVDRRGRGTRPAASEAGIPHSSIPAGEVDAGEGQFLRLEVRTAESRRGVSLECCPSRRGFSAGREIVSRVRAACFPVRETALVTVAGCVGPASLFGRMPQSWGVPPGAATDALGRARRRSQRRFGGHRRCGSRRLGRDWDQLPTARGDRRTRPFDPAQLPRPRDRWSAAERIGAASLHPRPAVAGAGRTP